MARAPSRTGSRRDQRFSILNRAIEYQISGTPSYPHASVIEEKPLTWDVHAPEGDCLQSIGSQSVTRIEETLNRAAEVLASGVDFAVGLPYEVVGELQGLVGDFWTITDALRVLAGGLKTLLEDFDCGLKAIGIFERSPFQEGYACETSQYIQKNARFRLWGGQHVPPRYAATHTRTTRGTMSVDLHVGREQTYVSLQTF